jgi:uncharacterized protein YdcH (DUF465 family)
MTREQHAREMLLQEDDEYRRLAEQHRELETRLGDLLGHSYLSGAEQFERATLKKKKLAVKDRMEHILRRHLAPRPGVAVPVLERHESG